MNLEQAKLNAAMTEMLKDYQSEIQKIKANFYGNSKINNENDEPRGHTPVFLAPPLHQNPTQNPRHDRSPRIVDPTVFKMEGGVSFLDWEVEALAKLYNNTDHFPTEESKMYFVYSSTTKRDRKFLYPRYKFDTKNHFVSAH